MSDKITACYVRVSTAEQKKEGHSIEVQTKNLQKYCEYKDYKDVEFFVDQGKSGGFIAKRPEMKRLLGLLDDGKLERILITKLSRFCRNLREFLDVVDIIRSKKCGFVSLSENIDTESAQGRFFLNIMMSMNQFEREITAERTEEIQLDLLDQKKILTRLPFGYKPLKRKINGKMRVWKWILDDKAAPIVNQIFSLAKRDHTKQEITKIVKMPYMTVSTILANKAYLGIQKYKDTYYKAAYPSIIQPEDFTAVNPEQYDLVQKILRQN